MKVYILITQNSEPDSNIYDIHIYKNKCNFERKKLEIGGSLLIGTIEDLWEIPDKIKPVEHSKPPRSQSLWDRFWHSTFAFYFVFLTFSVASLLKAIHYALEIWWPNAT